MESNSTAVNDESLRDRIMNKILRLNEEDDHHEQDICRVCRLAGDDTLYHPCLCTGSIKYVHQECLMQWLKYSKKEVCELCNHKFSFRPLYRADMPERLPIQELIKGMFVMAARFMRYFLVCCMVATCWLGFVPLMSSRIYRLVFSGLTSFFSLKIFTLFSLENIAADIGTGVVIVAIFTSTLFSLVWLKDQIMVGAPPAFLHLQEGNRRNARPQEIIHVELRDQQANEERDIQQSAVDNAPPDAAQFVEANNNQNTTDIAEDDRTTDDDDDYEENDTFEDDYDENDNLIDAEIDVENNRDVGGAPHRNNAANAVAGNNPENAAHNGEDADNNQNNEDADQLMDDFTWQRILGLDGSTAFIDAVFYVIAMNVIFDVLFLHWPSQVGMALFYLIGLSGKVIYFTMPIHVLTGYTVVFVANYLVHEFARYLRYEQLYTLSAMFHLMIKVFLLFVVEIILFPVISGWWLDICSLPLTGVTLEARLTMFRNYPFSSTFLHWMVGMIYVFYSASFILVLRELLRPGVLWFIRNLNDPEFNPILEMVQQSVLRHGRRLVASTLLFFTIILLVVYIPLRLIRLVSPHTLPYVLTASADTSMGEISMELVLLQLVLPTVLEYSKAFSVLKWLVQLWCRVVGGWLKLESYLLPRVAHVEADRDVNRIDNAERIIDAAIAAINQYRQRQRENGDNLPQEDVDDSANRQLLENNVNNTENKEIPQSAGTVHEMEKIVSPSVIEEKEDDSKKAIVVSRNDIYRDEFVISKNHLLDEASSSSEPTSSTLHDKNLGDQIIDDEAVPSTSSGLPIKSPTVVWRSRSASPQHRIESHMDDTSDKDVPLAPEQQANDLLPANEPPPPNEERHNALLAQQIIQRERQDNHLGARHQALLMIRENVEFEEYDRPNMFAARIVALLGCLALTAISISFLFFIIPVSIGRLLFTALSKIDSGALKNGTVSPTHELYTLAAGLYFCWVVSKVWIVAYDWCQKGWNYVRKVFQSMTWLAIRLLIAMIPIFIVIPFMLGLLFQLLVVAPLRVTMNQTPLFFPWKEWAIGVLHFKIFCASVLMGPDWWLKAAFIRVYAGGMINFELKFLLTELVLPLFNFISLQISLPYVGANIILSFFDLSDEEKIVYTRFAYPFTLMCVTALIFLFWQWQKLKSLAQKIRNDKYLIGTQLVNFYRESGASTSAAIGGGAAPAM